VSAGGVELVREAPTVGLLPVRLIVLTVMVLPAAVLISADTVGELGLEVGRGPVVVYVRVQGQFVIVRVVGYFG
jgi:hypothetical protein